MLNKKSLTIVISAYLSLVLTLHGADIVFAAEPGPLPHPPGATGDFLGELPPVPGLFLANQTLITEAYSLVDANGDKLPGSHFNSPAIANVTRLFASWGNVGPFQLYTQLIVPLIDGDSSLQFGGMPASYDKGAGFGNITISPLIASYKWGEQKENVFVAGYDYQSELGTYDSTQAFNPANGYSAHLPFVAYAYNAGIGPYFGAAIWAIFPERNSDTQYKTGNAFDIDYKAGWNFGNWRAGVVGGYYNQYNDDEGPAPLSGKTELLKIGPSFTYNFGKVILNVNYQMTAYARSGVKDNSLWVNLALPLWINMPQP